LGAAAILSQLNQTHRNLWRRRRSRQLARVQRMPASSDADSGCSEGTLRAFAKAKDEGVSPPKRNSYRTAALRSEEHTSELQSRENLVCRLLLEKKNLQ